MGNIFTKALQNVGSIVRQAGTGGVNAVQSRLASAGLFPGGISGASRKPLGSNSGSPGSTGDWAVKLTLARQTYSDLFGSSSILAGLTSADNGMRFPTTPFINSTTHSQLQSNWLNAQQLSIPSISKFTGGTDNNIR